MDITASMASPTAVSCGSLCVSAPVDACPMDINDYVAFRSHPGSRSDDGIGGGITVMDITPDLASPTHLSACL